MNYQNDITYIISTSALASGVYVLRIQEGDTNIRKEKFVVSH